MIASLIARVAILRDEVQTLGEARTNELTEGHNFQDALHLLYTIKYFIGKRDAYNEVLTILHEIKTKQNKQEAT